MKKTEMAMIVFIASISVVVAYVVASSLFGNFSKDAATVQTVDPIDSTIVAPRTDIFNSNAINPAIGVQINGTGTTGSQ